MKKTISIAISGIIFHIEEDGYQKLLNYLESIKRYFSGFDGADDIISDIEGRVAELFLLRLKEGRQAVTIDDVEYLIETLGSVKDFSSLNEEETAGSGSTAHAGFQSGNAGPDPYISERLTRNTVGKVFGGVAGGLGLYFNTDPVWFRMLFLIMFFMPMFTVIGGTLSLITAIVYIALWILLPGQMVFPEQLGKSVKKLYRDPNRKILGGVASGLAKFFGTDVIVIRLIFILLTLLFFTGLIIYIVLWMIVPEARTITEKMQMEGAPVTLENIESSVKKSLQPEGKKEESALTKIVLFPFRLIAMIVRGLGKIAKPIVVVFVTIVRVFAGFFLLMMGLGMIVSIIGLLVFSAGFWENYWDLSVEAVEIIQLVREHISVVLLLTVTGLIGMPGLALMISGASVMANKNLWNKFLAWILFGLWLLSIGSAAFLAANNRLSIQILEDRNFTMNYLIEGTPVIILDEQSLENPFRLRITGHASEELNLVRRSTLVKLGENRGSKRNYLGEAAQMKSDSILLITNFMDLPDNLKNVHSTTQLTLKIPYEKPFVMDPSLAKVLTGTLSLSEYHSSDLKAGNTWMFNEDGKLICLSCKD
jgi:phage shock protein PspC (stress-responsive transcriptional regulator)